MSGYAGAVGGGFSNQAGLYSIVAGGSGNAANGYSAVGGGNGNDAGSGYGAIAGGSGNTVGSHHGAVGGGLNNHANAPYATVSGGYLNTAGTAGGTEGPPVAGGVSNNATGYTSFIGAGFGNAAAGSESTVAGGGGNSASGYNSTVSGGGANTASGDYGTVAGGLSNTAGAPYSYAAGRRAKALADGSFVFGDSTDADVTSLTLNQFVVAASGGIVMATNKSLSTGCSIAAGGGTWTCTSDRSAKTDFGAVDPQSVLRRVATVPLSTWRFKGEAESVRHIGPFAQDFRAAFGLGQDDRTIALVDSEGVAMAAIQGLYQIVLEKDREVARLRARGDALERDLAEVKARLGM